MRSRGVAYSHGRWSDHTTVWGRLPLAPKWRLCLVMVVLVNYSRRKSDLGQWLEVVVLTRDLMELPDLGLFYKQLCCLFINLWTSLTNHVNVSQGMRQYRVEDGWTDLAKGSSYPKEGFINGLPCLVYRVYLHIHACKKWLKTCVYNLGIYFKI